MMIPGKSVDEHHLIPKAFKGKNTITMHRVCHTKLHATFTEREMLHLYHTVENIINHEEIKSFINWIKNKDPEFYTTNKETAGRKRKRRR